MGQRVRLMCGDAMGVDWRVGEFDTLVVDPPFDRVDLVEWAAGIEVETRLVFTTPGRLGEVVGVFGQPLWVFTWDTASPWRVGDRRPLTQTKFCLWYGRPELYESRFGVDRLNPGFRHQVGTKRALSDLYTESLRWLHAEEARYEGKQRWERAVEWRRHEKPLTWVAGLIANTSPGSRVLDPFAGTGTTLIAAKMLGRSAVGCEIDSDVYEYALERIARFDHPAPSAQGSLFTVACGDGSQQGWD